MEGRAGLYQSMNIVKRKAMSVREWVELCAKDEFCAPCVSDMGITKPAKNNKTRRERSTVKVQSSEPELPGTEHSIKDDDSEDVVMASPANQKKSRQEQKDALDEAFLDGWDYESAWLPPDTHASDYTPEACSEIERAYWRNCSLGKPAWYGADSMGRCS